MTAPYPAQRRHVKVNTSPAPSKSDTDYLGQALRNSDLAHAVDLITDPWCQMILRAAFMGTRRFEAFQQIVSAPRQTLSLRLAYLARIGLLSKQRQELDGTRLEYRLTPLGKSLHGNVLASWSWDRQWGVPHGQIPVRLVHSACGHAFRPVMVCEHCSEPLALHRVEPLHLRLEQDAQQRAVRNRRWRSPVNESETPDRDILAAIDDRWSVLIVAALMLCASRYEQLKVMLQISSAVLARRLQRLCSLGILVNWQDPADGRRSIYGLDKAGQDLFAYLLTLSTWGRHGRHRPDSIGWIHTRCRQRATGQMVCSHCRATLLPSQVVRTRLPADTSE
ncbi:MAG: winged helix-turn-helix transcriptional regulator [Burkholderiaceae bacterium]